MSMLGMESRMEVKLGSRIRLLGAGGWGGGGYCVICRERRYT